MPEVASHLNRRIAALMEGAAQWRDPSSDIRAAARAALEGGEWPPQVVERALDNALFDADAVLGSLASKAEASGEAPLRPHAAHDRNVLAILPGNVLGPTLATAYCAAAAGARLLLKSSSRELRLCELVAAQFSALSPVLEGTLIPMRWSGGDQDLEAKVFPSVQRILAFGSDETIADIKRRAPRHVSVIGYGNAYSVGYVPLEADVAAAAIAAAADVAMFDQRGCLSPQTIYVEGDAAKAILFAHALARALARLAPALPRAPAGDSERAAVAEFLRRLAVRALPATTHALDTVLTGHAAGGVPSYVVGVEPMGEPVCAGFGRIAIVKPAASATQAARAIGAFPHQLDTIGIAGALDHHRPEFLACSPSRICALGEMQRPPFGYRPRIADFQLGSAA